MRTVVVAAIGLTASFVIGCSDPPAAPRDLAWEAPPRYAFVVTSSCGERNFLGRYHVIVADGAVLDVAGLDRRSNELLDHPRRRVPTVTDLLEEARTARDDGADLLQITFHPVDGHPTAIAIDWSAAATDDEACYAISDYEVLE